MYAQLSTFLLGKTPPPQSQTEILFSSLGALIGIALVGWASQYFVGGVGLPFLVASMGAAAVLLFAMPHSPLAQPWPFIGGHLVSATVGVSCAQWIPDTIVAGAFAVALAIFCMHMLRCLHPPGGAAALVAVIGGDEIQALGYQYVLTPVGLNALIMLVTVLVFSALIRRRRVPMVIAVLAQEQVGDTKSVQPDFTPADLNLALQEMNTYIDVSPDDLHRIYSLAMLQSHQRRLGDMLCRDAMNADVLTVDYGTELEEVWGTMQSQGVNSVPVVDRARRVLGIISVADFVREAGVGEDDDIEARLAQLIKRTPGFVSDKPEVAGQLMTVPVVTVSDDTRVVHAVPLFSEHDIDSMPVINEEKRLVGVLYRRDVMGVLENVGK